MIILRVDDVGRAPDQDAWGPPDVRLEFFRRWRRESGIEARPLPIYYGVIPEQVTHDDVAWLHASLDPQVEELAVHGHDHRQGAIVTKRQMIEAQAKLAAPGCLDCRSYIPPFNAYDTDAVFAWRDVAQDGFFFGGQPHRDHVFGPLPVNVGIPSRSVFHVPAHPPFYAHAHDLVKRLDEIAAAGRSRVPYCLTFHTVWDEKNMADVKKVIDAVRPHVVPVDRIRDWSQTIADQVGSMDGAQRVPCYHVTRDLPPMTSVLDFGARYGKLAALLSLRGCDVTCFDRDPDLTRMQGDVFKIFGQPAPKTIVDSAPEGLKKLAGQFDNVTALWAIQHNLTQAEQESITGWLFNCLKPGGVLWVCSSFTPAADSTLQMHRADPQLILNYAGHQHLIATLGGVVLDDFTFEYRHGTKFGERCPADRANAIFYRIQRQ